MSDDLVIEQFRLGALWNFSYLLWSRSAGEAVVIDPGAEGGVLRQRAGAVGLRITAVIATHFHKDHTSGIAGVLDAGGTAVWINHADEQGLRGHYGGPLRPANDGDCLRLSDHLLSLWHAPGHTPGSQWIVVDGAVFTGDTLMVGCVGRVGHERDAVERMWWTFSEQFPRLPDSCRIYPGHDYGPERSSTVGVERGRNPILQASGPEEFARLVQAEVQGVRPTRQAGEHVRFP